MSVVFTNHNIEDHMMNSMVELHAIRYAEKLLISKGFTYLSISSMITRETLHHQGLISWEQSLKVSTSFGDFALSGSAEQGLLEFFRGHVVEPSYWFATNQCFRNESSIAPNFRLLEFRKVEQFGFCSNLKDVSATMKDFLDNAEAIYRRAYAMSKGGNGSDLNLRLLSVDAQYEACSKVDLEYLHPNGQWLELASCTHYSPGLAEAFSIKGATDIVSCTAFASPRGLFL